MRQGALKAGAGVELKLQEQALSGDLDAMELLEKVRGRRSFEIIVKQIDEDEFG